MKIQGVSLIQNAKHELGLRADLPEFTFKRNQPEARVKSIFVHDTGLCIEEALEVAKDLAQRMGMGDKASLKVEDIVYSARKKGWQILVQKRF